MRGQFFPSVPQALLLLLVVLIVGAAVSLIAGMVIGVTSGDLNAIVPWIVAFQNLVIFGLATAIGWRLTRRPARQVFPLRPVGVLLLAVAVLTCLAALVLLSELDNLIRVVAPPPEAIDQLMLSVTGGSFWGSLLALVVVAPLTEETLFRGVLLRGFRSRYSPRAAIWWSAILFALFHLNPWQMPSALLFGLLFAWMTIRANSLIPSILAHAATNSLTLVAGFTALADLLPGISSPAPGVQAGFQPLWLDLTAALLTALGLFVLHRLQPKEAAADKETAEEAEEVEAEEEKVDEGMDG